MKKIILAALLCVLGICGAFAQNWTKETQNEFKNAKEVAVDVDFTGATIMGVSLERFPKYYSKKFNKDEELADMVLEQFENQFRLVFFNKIAKKKIESKDAQFKVVYKIQELTEEGGFRGYFYVEKDGDKSATFPFSQKDGRWNDFEVLCKENIIKFFKGSGPTSYEQSNAKSGNSPYSKKLYKY